MLKQRLISAAIALPLVLSFLIFAPSAWVLGFFTICVLLSVYEAAKLVVTPLELGASSWHKVCWYGLTPLYGAGVFVLAAYPYAQSEGLSLVLCALWALIPMGIFILPGSSKVAIPQAMGLIFAVCYGGLPWVSLWKLYTMGGQARFLLLLFAIVMLCDTGAYFAGRRFGRTKLAPQLSPSKSWEGVLGGLCAALCGAQLMNLIFGCELYQPLHLVWLSTLTAFAGILGDLVESSLKRYAGVKDSGQLIPGHGGFLDRVDALLFAAPVLWFALTYLSRLVWGEAFYVG